MPLKAEQENITNQIKNINKNGARKYHKSNTSNGRARKYHKSKM